jgi:hypothetical protein
MQSSSTDRTTDSSYHRGEDKTLEQFSSSNESKKADNLALEPILLGCFHGSDESQRCSTDPELFFTTE